MNRLSIEVSLFEAVVQEDTACYVCQELVRGVPVESPGYGVVLLLTCGVLPAAIWCMPSVPRTCILRVGS